jgi:glycine cleavage system aminomethyltransferase T
LNDSVNPKEVYLDSEISSDKHDYIGHENVEDENSELGRLVKLEFDKAMPKNLLPATICDETNREVGIVTSSTNSSLIEKQIGLGFVLGNYHLNGNSYFISDSKNKVKVKICELSK